MQRFGQGLCHNFGNMKKSIFQIALIFIVFTSCEKTSSTSVSNSLEGIWKMTIVKDFQRNLEVAKPSGVTGEVIVSFHPENDTTGTFSGNTPTNTFGPDIYSISGAQYLSMPVLTMTKVAENEWGKLFVDNIRHASAYDRSMDKLYIYTLTKVLIFQKL